MGQPLGQLLTAMATPLTAEGSVNQEATRRLARHLVDTGSDGIVVCGTTGEGPTLSDHEKLGLFETVVSEVGGGHTVVANTGTYDTHHSVALTRAALATGVDGFLVVTPYYNKPPRAGLVAHFAAVADAADGRPVMIYNIPQRVVLNLDPDLLAELSQIENVVGVKQATADLDQAQRLVNETDLALYAGNDDLVFPFLELGGAGGVCVASHIAGRDYRRMIDLMAAGDLAGARSIHDSLQPLLEALAITTNPIPLKAALNLLGFDAGGLRLPLVEADAAERAAVAAALEAAGLLPVVAG
jgi:4-hydroxy-tetrahydrodipicolinate synthase